MMRQGMDYDGVKVQGDRGVSWSSCARNAASVIAYFNLRNSLSELSEARSDFAAGAPGARFDARTKDGIEEKEQQLQQMPRRLSEGAFAQARRL